MYGDVGHTLIFQQKENVEKKKEAKGCEALKLSEL